MSTPMKIESNRKPKLPPEPKSKPPRQKKAPVVPFIDPAESAALNDLDEILGPGSDR